MVQGLDGANLIEQSGLSVVVLEAKARGMSDLDIVSFIHEEYGLVEVTPKNVADLIDRELADPRMSRALALSRKRGEMVAPLPTVGDIESRIVAQIDGLESLMRDVHGEYVMGKATRGDDLRDVLRGFDIKLSEAQMRDVLKVARKLSLDRAIANASQVSRELRGTIETWLKMKGLGQPTSTVNVLSVQSGVEELLPKLCAACQARVAGLEPPEKVTDG